jgi:hypothetical protein
MMFVRTAIAVLLSASLVAAGKLIATHPPFGSCEVAYTLPAPARQEHDLTPVEKGLKYKTRAQKREPLVIQQNIIEPTVVVVEQNLDTIENLALLAEQQFAALVHSQLSLIQTVENIKNNIRINHFKSRFNTVVRADLATG